MRITAVDGRNFETYVPYPGGGPENPHGACALTDKFMMLCGAALGPARAEALAHRLDHLEDIGDAGEIAALFAAPPVTPK